jgi:hypothetical protein
MEAASSFSPCLLGSSKLSNTLTTGIRPSEHSLLLNSQNNFLIVVVIITSSLQQPSIEFRSPSFQSPTIWACSETVLLGVSLLAAAVICCSYQCWVGTWFGRLLELWVPVPIRKNWTGTWSDFWNWVWNWNQVLCFFQWIRTQRGIRISVL